MHMTCKICGHGFCWLCLGGKESHGGTDGHIYQCDNIAMAEKRGFKVDVKQNTEKDEFELYKFDYYAMRYREHQKSIQFASKQFDVILL